MLFQTRTNPIGLVSKVLPGHDVSQHAAGDVEAGEGQRLGEHLWIGADGDGDVPVSWAWYQYLFDVSNDQDDEGIIGLDQI